ncbi:MAG: hypothetical protein ACXWUG_11865 [Polyangiales bacterium]
MNQTTQMHAIARELGEAIDPWFTPYYVDGVMEVGRKLGLIDMTIAGRPWAERCFDYLRSNDLAVDYRGQRADYNLVFQCQDAFMPQNIRDKRVILVQEGMTDPEGLATWLVRKLGAPRWLASTSLTGTSDLYEKFCVASPGYRDLFIRKGVRPEKIVVTGIPNFDDMAKYRVNSIAARDYVLVCTSDTRETFNYRDDRRRFLKRCKEIAGDRPIVFKLHPNENHERNSAEIRQWFPQATIHRTGSAEEMVANCSVLVCEYSTLAFVGIALEKEVHTHYDLAELRRLLPLQNRSAARNIAEVAREMLGIHPIVERMAAE